jgi:hypothetical protein
MKDPTGHEVNFDSYFEPPDRMELTLDEIEEAVGYLSPEDRKRLKLFINLEEE